MLLLVAVAIVFCGGVYVVMYTESPEDPQQQVLGYKDVTYVIDGTAVTLVDGVSEVRAEADSSAMVTTRYFGNELHTDLDGDGKEDVVFLVTQDAGGSGTFFYVVAARNTEQGYVGSDGYFLGDRIAPQTTELSRNPVHKHVVVVNYADRASGEPMSVQPSVGTSVYLKLDAESMQWGVVEQNFEGEADASHMSLSMKEWEWQRAEFNDGRTVLPNKDGVFTLTFMDDGSVSVGTDCNSVGGTYRVDGSSVTFTDMRMTRMYCEGSQETEFVQLLDDTSMFHFTSRGELILELKYDSGIVIFK